MRKIILLGLVFVVGFLSVNLFSYYSVLSGKMMVKFDGTSFGIEPSKIKVCSRLIDQEILCKIYNDNEEERTYSITTRTMIRKGENFELSENHDRIKLKETRKVIQAKTFSSFVIMVSSDDNISDNEESWIVVREETESDVSAEMVLRIQYSLL